MHALGPDQLHGYAERLVGDHAPNHLGGSPVDRGALSGTAGPDRVSLAKSGSGQNAYQVHDEYVTAATIDLLNRLGVQKRSGQLTEPFSITVGFMLPHPPYVTRRGTYQLYLGRVAMPRKPEPFSDDLHPFLQWWRQQTGIVEVSEEEVLRARAAYWGLVSEVDTMVGQILSALNANGLADNTLIIYSSDHGDMQGEHGLWWKHVFYEESVKVPLILSWPGTIPAGQRCERVVSALDLTATMLEALGAPSLPNSSGRSFLGLITGQDEEWEDQAFSEYCSDEYCPGDGCYQRMVRCGEWKLVHYHGQEPQLFNLAEDPDELLDRAQDAPYREIRQELTKRVLDGWDADEIAAKMAAQRADNQILRSWARHVRPADRFRWNLRPEMNYLDQTS
jgi:choline-sulfatase